LHASVQGLKGCDAARSDLVDDRLVLDNELLVLRRLGRTSTVSCACSDRQPRGCRSRLRYKERLLHLLRGVSACEVDCAGEGGGGQHVNSSQRCCVSEWVPVRCYQ
jgi:hypothetical protein